MKQALIRLAKYPVYVNKPYKVDQNDEHCMF